LSSRLHGRAEFRNQSVPQSVNSGTAAVRDLRSLKSNVFCAVIGCGSQGFWYSRNVPSLGVRGPGTGRLQRLPDASPRSAATLQQPSDARPTDSSRSARVCSYAHRLARMQHLALQSDSKIAGVQMTCLVTAGTSAYDGAGRSLMIHYVCKFLRVVRPPFADRVWVTIPTGSDGDQHRERSVERRFSL